MDIGIKNGVLQPTGKFGEYTYLAIYTKQFEWVETLHALNITSLILSCITIVVVVACIRHKDFVERPSFRLSASIACGDIAYSLGHMLLYHNSVDNHHLSEIKLRVMFWLWFFGLALMVFSTTCIAFHLHLTAVMNKAILARKLSPWYELFAWTVSIIVSQPILYTYFKFIQVPLFKSVVLLEKSRSKIQLEAWLIYIWMALALVYCFIVCVLVVIRLLPIWRRSAMELKRPEGHDSSSVGVRNESLITSTDKPGAYTAVNFAGDVNTAPNVATTRRGGSGNNRISRAFKGFATGLTGNNQVANSPATLTNATFGTNRGALGFHQPPMNTNATPQKVLSPTYMRRRRREIQWMVIRIFIYPIIPLVTTIWQPIYHTTVDSTITQGYLALLFPSMQAIFNFAVFLVNPTMDEFWHKVWQWIKFKFMDYRDRRNFKNIHNERVEKLTINTTMMGHRDHRVGTTATTAAGGLPTATTVVATATTAEPVENTSWALSPLENDLEYPQTTARSPLSFDNESESGFCKTNNNEYNADMERIRKNNNSLNDNINVVRRNDTSSTANNGSKTNRSPSGNGFYNLDYSYSSELLTSKGIQPRNVII